MTDPVPTQLSHILRSQPELKESYLVGGCVRDWLLGLPNKDVDVEVFGIDYEHLARVLQPFGRTDAVGRSFGVLKLTLPSGETFDFSIPRRDSKTGIGHKGFEVEFDPTITPQEAASRRDFTLNALMYHVASGKVLDFFGGLEDLKARRLRHTSSAFTEDPLRVLRGMQFAGRFQLTAVPETLELCRSIRHTYPELAIERVREEWFKWASKSIQPSLGIRFLHDAGWLPLFPEIQALQGVEQDPEWHPEGDVYIHTCHCLDAMVRSQGWIERSAEDRTVLTLAILSHDFAKPHTTTRALKNGVMRIVSPGHEEAGGEIARTFLERFKTPHAIVDRVVPLVMNHLAHLQTSTPKATRRLARKLHPATITELGLVVLADISGRPPRPAVASQGLKDMLAHAEALRLEESAPKPILLGRHLIELGLRPGTTFRPLLDRAFEAQLDGEFETLEQAWRWLAAQTDPELTQEVRLKLQEKI